MRIYKLSLIVLLSFGLAACAGRTPNPIQVYQPDDEQLTCSEISEQITSNQQKVQELFPQTQKTGKNVGLGIAGAFFLVPWFFMDFSDAERIEIQAYQQRDTRLHFLAERKRCGQMPPRIQLQQKTAK